MPTTLILSWRHNYTQKHCPHITLRQCHVPAHSHIHTQSCRQTHTLLESVCVCAGQFVQDKRLPILVFCMSFLEQSLRLILWSVGNGKLVCSGPKLQGTKL